MPMAVVFLLGFTNHINILEDNVDIYSYQYIYICLFRKREEKRISIILEYGFVTVQDNQTKPHGKSGICSVRPVCSEWSKQEKSSKKIYQFL